MKIINLNDDCIFLQNILELDAEAMANTVDKKLYRNRRRND